MTYDDYSIKAADLIDRATHVKDTDIATIYKRLAAGYVALAEFSHSARPTDECRARATGVQGSGTLCRPAGISPYLTQ
jgi:hypothetical protein